MQRQIDYNMQTPLKAINIDEIPAVRSEYYENIFSVYQVEVDSMYYFYNISKKVVFDIENVDDQYIDYIFIDRPMPFTTISYKLFNTIHLWWLIVVMNKLNPIKVLPAGTIFAVPKREHLSDILGLISSNK